ncbi:unnamed protein product [Euphydryas editha]|uniref:Uncharacterized protein n=1 Tax=Euphydryas editha TaxID=104508 RepID=A0AAU9UPL2_EUPED|nr:unnamed protein product [Euphydryas editha]
MTLDLFVSFQTAHITQPLDVAFFRPVKIGWRNILANWKANTQGSREKLLADLEENCEQNLKTGFKKCGIHPIDVMPLLERLSHPINKDAVQDSFLEILEAKRQEWMKEVNTRKRRFKLSIVPRKSVTEELHNLENK